jgi:ArsR family transcriptional regulator
MKDHEKMLSVVKVFKALGDPVRMKLIRALATQFDEKASVNDLVGLFNISQPAISQHLKILLNMEIVKAEKQGYYMYYSVNQPKIIEYKKLIDEIFKIGFIKCEKFPNCDKCSDLADCPGSE